MKIWIHKYQLQPVDARFKKREGALVKIEWVLNQFGFSDLHPWPEFGEAALEEHLESLRQLRFSKLAERSVEFNYIDREHRLAKKNVFAGLIPPRSHRLVTNVAVLDAPMLGEFHRQGFSHIKVKMGDDLAAETPQLLTLALSTPILWRIDMNGKVSAADFTAWWNALPQPVRARIDLVEDPTSGETLKIAGPWADDWKKQERAQIRVIKPARESVEELAKYNRVIFTHGMDHSLGQACAAWSASRYYANHPKRLEVCGLAATALYSPDEFSQEWRCEGPRLKGTTGFGFGFDKQLAGLSWERLL